jgi:DNA-binding HxlR family transcriptional regulator
VTAKPQSLPPSFQHPIEDRACPSFQGALELVGRRWSGAILLAAAHGAQRFGQYRAMISGISDRLLAQRLRELEAEVLIERTVIPTQPVQIRHRLTTDGQELISILQPLAEWNLRRSGSSGRKAGAADGAGDVG